MPVLIAICVVTFLDQLTKTLVSLRLAHHETIPVIAGFFNLAHVHNTGAAFSVFHDSNTPLALFSAVILTGLVVFRKHFFCGPAVNKFAIALVASGIIGNLLDRLKFESVVDIFDFYVRGHHFPTFNIADSSICIGVAIYVLSGFLGIRMNVTESRTKGVGPETKESAALEPGDAIGPWNGPPPTLEQEKTYDSSLHRPGNG